MKKKVPVLVTTVLCTASLSAGVAASGVVTRITAEFRPDFKVVVDNEVKSFKNAQGEAVYPVLYDGTTYLPLRAVGELMGKKVYWYENEKKIELKQEEEPTVTDADVIVTDDTDNAAKDSGRKEKAFDKKDYEAKADKDGLITVEEAKAIALEKAGLTEAEVTFEKAKPDYDDGIRIYDIEFRSGNIEYDAEIDAETGEIIEFEKDND